MSNEQENPTNRDLFTLFYIASALFESLSVAKFAQKTSVDKLEIKAWADRWRHRAYIYFTASMKLLSKHSYPSTVDTKRSKSFEY